LVFLSVEAKGAGTACGDGHALSLPASLEAAAFNNKRSLLVEEGILASVAAAAVVAVSASSSSVLAVGIGGGDDHNQAVGSVLGNICRVDGASLRG